MPYLDEFLKPAPKWCHGDDALCLKVSRAWPLKNLARMLGKHPVDVRKRYPKAGKPRALSAEAIATIKEMLSGHALWEIAEAIGTSPDEVLTEANRLGLDLDVAGDAFPERFQPVTPAVVRSVERMTTKGVNAAEIASALGRSVTSIYTIQARYLRQGGAVSGGERVTKDCANLTAPEWPPEALDDLRVLYGTMPSKALAERLGRSPDAVRAKARALGLAGAKRPRRAWNAA